MKVLNAIFTTAIALIFTLHLGAQDKPVSLQARVGLTLSNLRAYNDGETDQGKFSTAFNVGAILDCHLAKSSYLHTGLLLISKGAEIKEVSMNGGGYADEKIDMLYLQVPIYYMYKASIPNNENKINFGGGPYLAYGIGGKSTYTTGRSSFDVSVDTFGDNGQIKRFDAGIGFEIQFEMPKIVFSLNSEYGIPNIFKKEYLLYDVSVRNISNSLSVAYKF